MSERTAPAGKRPGSAGETDEVLAWGELYFSTVYDAPTLADRARQDYDAVMAGGYNQVLVVPPQPLEGVVASPSAGSLIRRRTLEAASVALWQVQVFNQLVEQQSAFYMSHIDEILDSSLPHQRRELLAQAAATQCAMLHGRGIGDAGSPSGWYTRLKREIVSNAEALDKADSRVWLSLVLPVATLVAAAALVALVYSDDDDGASPPATPTVSDPAE